MQCAHDNAAVSSPAQQGRFFVSDTRFGREWSLTCSVIADARSNGTVVAGCFYNKMLLTKTCHFAPLTSDAASPVCLPAHKRRHDPAHAFLVRNLKSKSVFSTNHD
jgi:hypothetical protein